MFSHLHVALAAVALYVLYAFWLGVVPDGFYLIFLFASTVLYYTFLRIIHLSEMRVCVARWFEMNLKRVLILDLFLSVVLVYAVFGLTYARLLKIFLVFIPAVMYHLNSQWGKVFSWRNIGWVKILVISLVWAAMTVWVPFSGTVDNDRLSLVFFHAVIFVLLWTLPFDIRDLSMDAVSLKTIPQVFKEKTLAVAFAVVSVYVLLTLYLEMKLGRTFLSLIFVMAGLLLLGAVALAPKKSEDYYFTAFWVEGIPVLMLSIAVVWRFFFIR